MDNNFTESLHQLVQKINDPMWTGLVYVLLGAGLFFTVATGFVQFRLLGRSIKEMLGGRQQGDDPHGITPFQAFVTGLASRVGVGNIAGVAIAISSGGPGAVFWMWIIDRYEFGVCRIFTGAVVQNPRLRQPSFSRRSCLLYYPRLGSKMVGHRICIEPDFLLRIRL